MPSWPVILLGWRAEPCTVRTREQVGESSDMCKPRMSTLLIVLVIVWGTAILLTLAATVFVWQLNGGWYYTPGWGSAGAIAVGLLAIVVSTIFNITTLNRTAENLRLAQQTYT